MIVHNGFGGSVVVVQIDAAFEHYIDTRKDVRHPGFVFIEEVVSGQVTRRDSSLYEHAPEVIMRMINPRYERRVP